METDELHALRADLEDALSRVDRLLACARADEPSEVSVPALTTMARTVAIETVLSRTDQPMRPIEVWQALRDAGRDDPKMEVQVTTFDLWQRGRIGKVSRGLYVSTPDKTTSQSLRGAEPLAAS